MDPVLIVVVVVAVAVAGVLLLRAKRRTPTTTTSPSTALAPSRLPPEGLLVPEEVLRSAGTAPVAIWEALSTAAAPVALQYYPVTQTEISKYRMVPVNASAQQALIKVVEAINPKGPTLFKAVLPKGAELVKAVGADGFRGFSRTGGETVHAVLKPVAAGGAIAAGWPVFAVAGTVMLVDMAAQRDQRAHQARVEGILNRQEDRYFIERITAQRSADKQLTRVISQMLDGHRPNLELALKSADDEFHRSQHFLETHCGTIEDLVGDDGKVDRAQLEVALGGKTKDVDYFVRELHLARAAIALRRKALAADGAAHALADPTNPYKALRKFWDGEAHQIDQADTAAAELTEQIISAELKGSWRHSRSKIAKRQELLREQIAAPTKGDEPEVLYLVTASNEIVQLLPPESDPEIVEPSDDAEPPSHQADASFDD